MNFYFRVKYFSFYFLFQVFFVSAKSILSTTVVNVNLKKKTGYESNKNDYDNYNDNYNDSNNYNNNANLNYYNYQTTTSTSTSTSSSTSSFKSSSVSNNQKEINSEISQSILFGLHLRELLEGTNCTVTGEYVREITVVLLCYSDFIHIFLYLISLFFSFVLLSLLLLLFLLLLLL